MQWGDPVNTTNVNTEKVIGRLGDPPGQILTVAYTTITVELFAESSLQ
jgi:hypothetical protein